MDWNAVGLANQITFRIRQEAGEIMGLCEDWAARGSGHHPPHRQGDVIQPVLHKGDPHGIKGFAHQGTRGNSGERGTAAISYSAGTCRVLSNVAVPTWLAATVSAWRASPNKNFPIIVFSLLGGALSPC
jgi:hypothetical protein